MGCNCRSRLERIIEGWENFIFRNSETEEIAKQRARLCASCPENKREWCKICTCYIPAKTRSLAEKCPKNLW